MIGRTLGSWQLEQELGQGTLGVVYRARHTDSPNVVAAVKLLVDELASDPVFLFRFEREVDALKVLDHPNLARLLHAGIQDQQPYLVMEYVEGIDCQTLLREQGPIAWERLLEGHLLQQIILAMRHAHQRGILHRDLKPSNLLWTVDDQIKVTDFGVAPLLARPALCTGDRVLGSIAYLAPEQATGKPVGKRADIYALGGVLYTLLTGRTPFPGSNLIELLHKHCFSSPERPSRIVPNLPRELDTLLVRMLAKEPGQRPADGVVLLKELQALHSKLHRQGLLACPPKSVPLTDEQPALAAEPASPPPPPPPRTPQRFTPVEMEPPPRPIMQRPAVVISLFLGILALAGLGVYSVTGRPGAEELYQRAQTYMQSDNPEDWMMAWNTGLAELHERFPSYRSDEVTAFQVRAEAVAALRRAIAADRLKPPPRRSEPERLFWQGVAHLRNQDLVTARQVWQALITAFAPGNSADPWVNLAREGLRTTQDHQARRRPRRVLEDPAVQKVLNRVQQLRQVGPSQEAEALLESLQILYGSRFEWSDRAHDSPQKDP